MRDSPASLLARRLARVLRASALALPAAACGGNVIVDGGPSGTGGASSSTSTTPSSTTGAGGAAPACAPGLGCPDGPGGPGPEWMACFAQPPGQPCPDAAVAQPYFAQGCVSVSSVFAACVGGPAGQCCYNVAAVCACIGRPFVVQGAPRVAPIRDDPHGGFGGDEAFDGPDLPRATRDALAAAYLEDALGEHASIASFGRFALELMALGAPAELVEAAHRAALDEVRHARLAFGLAGAFGGAPVGPGPFPLPPAVPLRSEPLAFARALVVEGCIGETLAALLAAERAAAATDARVRAALHAIAEDEARHAELAWRTMAWVLAGHAGVADVVFAELARAERHAPTVRGAAPGGADLRAFGVLDAGATRAVLAAGLAEIVGPSTRELQRWALAASAQGARAGAASDPYSV